MGNVEKCCYTCWQLLVQASRMTEYIVSLAGFRTMEDKMPAVICLNAYNDGRAIPMLRGYLERNTNIERTFFMK